MAWRDSHFAQRFGSVLENRFCFISSVVARALRFMKIRKIRTHESCSLIHEPNLSSEQITKGVDGIPCFNDASRFNCEWALFSRCSSSVSQNFFA